MSNEPPSSNEKEQAPKEEAKPELLKYLLNPAKKAAKTTTLYVPITAGSETEVKKFIKEEIWSNLKERALWFGVANFVALVGIYFAVLTVAKDSANEEAKQTAHLAVDTVNRSVGEAFTGALNKFLDSLNALEQQKAKVASGIQADQEDLRSLNASLEAFKRIPSTEVTDFIKALNDDAKALIPKVDEALSDLKNLSKNAPSEFQFLKFVSEGGRSNTFVENYSNGKDQRLLNGSDTGIDTDCTFLSPPSNARGAIVSILIAPGRPDLAAFFIPADATGKISGVSGSPGLANFNAGWIGGVAFCPFYKPNTFRWTVGSQGKNFDTDVGCIGRIIGWF